MLNKEEIKKYLETDLLNELNLSDLAYEDKLNILAKLADVVYFRFINFLAENISDEDSEILEKIISDGKEGEFENFINEKFPNNQEILAQIIAEEKKNLLDILKVEK